MLIARLIVLALVLGVLAIPAFLWAFQTWGVYRFPKTAEEPGDISVPDVKRVRLTASDGADIFAWVAQPDQDKPVVVSFHGNFTTIAPSFERLSPLVEAGFGLVMLEYRGAGPAPGRLTETRMKADALTVFDAVPDIVESSMDGRAIFVHGYSLGSSPGIWLAANRKVAGLVVEAGYARLFDYWERRYKGIPLFRFMWAERNENDKIIGTVKAPVLVAHGAKDPAVPLAWSQQLFDAATAPKRFILYPEGAHVDLTSQGLISDVSAFFADPEGFVSKP